MNTPGKTYYTTTETARFMRKALKLAWPNIKFSVRSESYAGGSSVTVRWTDGPTRWAIENYLSGYQDVGFDGMIDMQYSKESWLLPDGRALYAGTNGTTSGCGCVEPYDTKSPCEGAERVSFGAGYVFAERKLSDEYKTGSAEIWERMDITRQCNFLNNRHQHWPDNDAESWAWNQGLEPSIDTSKYS